MQKVKKDDLIPLFKRARLTKNFDEDEITVPEKYIPSNIQIQYHVVIKNDDDFYRVMEQMRFWVVEELPYDIHDYVFVYKPDIEKYKDFFYNELKPLYDLELPSFKIYGNIPSVLFGKICDSKTWDVMTKYAEQGLIHAMKYLRMRGLGWCPGLANSAGGNNQIEFLKYLKQENYPHFNVYSYEDAARNGHIEAIKYLLSIKVPKTTGEYGWSVRDSICNYACEGGQLETLKFLCKNRFKIYSKTSEIAAKNCNLDCLKYCQLNGSLYNEDILENVLEGYHIDEKQIPTGNLECVEFLVRNGAQVTSNAVNNAAINGQLDIIKYLIYECDEIDYNVINNAAEYGHLDVLKYFHDYGIPITHVTVLGAVVKGRYECMKYLYEKAPKQFPKNIIISQMFTYGDYYDKDAKCLKYLEQKGFEVKSEDIYTMCKTGHLEAFKYIVRQYEIDKYKCRRYAEDERQWKIVEYIKNL